jgi:hypothetical protein
VQQGVEIDELVLRGGLARMRMNRHGLMSPWPRSAPIGKSPERCATTLVELSAAVIASTLAL